MRAKLCKYTYFYIHDHLGSTSMVLDADGNISQSVTYIPYGEIFLEERNGSWNSPYLFNSKELDEETGLYYYGARYLNPTNGIWLSVDPLWEKYVGMSPYNYCAGNPVKLVDPDGRKIEALSEESQTKSIEYIDNELGENHGFCFNNNGELKYIKNNSFKNYNKDQKALFKGLKRLVKDKNRIINVEITNDKKKNLFNIDIKRGDELLTDEDGRIVYDNNGLPKLTGTLSVVATETIDIRNYGGAFLYSNEADGSNTAYVKINTALLGKVRGENGNLFKQSESSVFFHEILDHGLDFLKNGNTFNTSGNSANNVKYQNHALQNQKLPLRKEHHH